MSSFFLEWTEKEVESKRKCEKTTSSMLSICQLFEIHAHKSKRHLHFNLQQAARLCVILSWKGRYYNVISYIVRVNEEISMHIFAVRATGLLFCSCAPPESKAFELT